MRRVIVTGLGRFLLAAEEENGRITGLFPEDPGKASLVGRIYVGRVKNIVKNIRAAFVEVGLSEPCYLSLEEWEQSPTAEMAGRPLKEGDLIPVQIERDAVKKKAPSAVTALSFTGQYLVLITGKEGIFFSSRIRDEERRKALRELLSREEHFYRLIVRTNAQDAPKEAVLHELHALRKQAEEILSLWKSRMPGALLYEPDPPYFSQIFNNRLHFLDEVVTDKKEVYEAVSERIARLREADSAAGLPALRLYEDAYPLSKLYSLEAAAENALKERVWLDCGGFLIIQPTEALVSIDVNTGKYAGKKSLEETFFKINLEAARVIARELKLRNLSGIIIVDFIDMKEEAHREAVLKALSDAVETDPVKTFVLGFTRLGLAELTRQKIRRPLHEIWEQGKFT